MSDYHGKKVVIIGLGISGLSCIDFFLKQGVYPKVIDTRIFPPNLNKLPSSIKRHFGSINRDWILNADLIVISPGITLEHPFLKEAAEEGIEIVGDIELFCRETQIPIIAITGSNGKSTVTTIVAEMARAAGLVVGVGGNIGFPVLNLLKQPAELYVLELSSFQLETTKSLKSIAATILNISEDHMDRYPFGLQQYCENKLRIYENAEVCVVNVDDKLTIPKYSTNNPYISVGLNTGEYNLCRNRDCIWLCAKGEKILNTNEMKIVGLHNYINALTALALSDAVGLPRTSSLKTLTIFQGLPHRFQLVYQHRGIHWINDSKATNVGSTKAALSEIQTTGTLWLLLGGDGKSADFMPLVSHLQNDTIRINCYGFDGATLATLRPEVSTLTKTLDEAMVSIASQVRSGDVVLLSPACSSFDQFRNFEQRGNFFTKLARELG